MNQLANSNGGYMPILEIMQNAWELSPKVGSGRMVGGPLPTTVSLQ